MFSCRPISDVHPNEDNPRIINKGDFARLVQSLKRNPKLFEARPIILSDRTGKLVAIAGNQRWRAAKEAGISEVPTFLISGLTEAQEKEILVRDNVSNGNWDWDALANSWDAEKLTEWGVPVWQEESGSKAEQTDKTGREADNRISGKNDAEGFEGAEAAGTPAVWVPDCLYPSDNHFEVPTLLPELAAKELSMPFAQWGADARTKTGIGTYAFYVDDYRFEALWKTPNRLVESGAVAAVEPNCSLYDTTPVAYGLHQIYKKRWMARYWQSQGIRIWADLNVADKFSEYNLLGIPKGWNAFFSRGYAERPEATEAEIQIAREISGLDVPNMAVYGGGETVKRVCERNGIIHIHQPRLYSEAKNTATNG